MQEYTTSGLPSRPNHPLPSSSDSSGYWNRLAAQFPALFETIPSTPGATPLPRGALTAPQGGGVATASPIGFITTPQCLTNGKLTQDQKFYSTFSSSSSHELYKEQCRIQKMKSRVRLESSDYLAFSEKYSSSIKFASHPSKSVLKIDRYNSGEHVLTQVTLGSHSKVIPSPTTGKRITDKLTTHAMRALRRAVENAVSDLKYFWTLTFAPEMLTDEQKNDDGSVCHSWAKDELRRFLNTASVAMKRKGSPLEYIWTSELQKNGNIHYHILANRYIPVKMLSKWWKQASNSVDVELVKDSRHACNYIRKYLSKQDEAVIEGNRYGITSGLRETMKPSSTEIIEHYEVKTAMEVINSMKQDIESSGGFVHSFGLCIGVPCRSLLYRDKDTGQTRKTRGLPSWLAGSIVDAILGEVPF
jgi:hypothetical protein